MPKSPPASSEMPNANAITSGSSDISSSRGRLLGAIATNRRIVPYATPSPATPPARPSAMLSNSSSRAMRPRPAPRAERMASSCWRPSALTSSRFATFAHAISSTAPMVPISTQSTSPMSPTTSCLNSRTAGASRAFANRPTVKPGGGGKSVSMTGRRRATSALADATVMPGFRRAMPR